MLMIEEGGQAYRSALESRSENWLLLKILSTSHSGDKIQVKIIKINIVVQGSQIFYSTRLADMCQMPLSLGITWCFKINLLSHPKLLPSGITGPYTEVPIELGVERFLFFIEIWDLKWESDRKTY